MNIAVCTFLLLTKHCTSSLIFLITQKNYLIIFERVDKLSKKNIYLRKILNLDLDFKIFGLWIWITLHFTGFGLEIFWTVIYNYTYQILYWHWTWKNLDYKFGLQLLYIFYGIWTWKHSDYGFGFQLLFISLDLDVELLGLWFRIMINLKSL